MTDQVQFTVEGKLGRIVLDRPKALNALTLPMVEAIDTQLKAWADDDAVQVVSIEGAGERGLCAGGDVVAVRAEVLDGQDGQTFFDVEYDMNARIAHFPKPIVAFQDGFVLGGGVGVSSHCRVRLATERTKVGMPETIIGFFPDVGAMQLLTRSPGEIGTHLALTGVNISGADAVFAGLSDAVIDSGSWEKVLEGMREGRIEYDEIDAESELAQQQGWIDECYAGDNAATILERLETGPEEAQKTAALIRKRSPYAVAVTLAALRKAASMETIDEVLDQDRVVARAMSHHPDFAEGVRSQLVDKDRDPKWTHPDVASVPAAHVSAALG